jgi:TolB-like protein/class 3 adenylate cyclase/cytochrome c-type biogenesis protein CcmH/NrfG
MPAESKRPLRLEIGHVLFVDIVSYSSLLISEQSELLGELNDAVRGTEHFRSAEAEGRLIRLPTGDGMALVFRNSPEEPVRCALEISQAIKNNPKLQVRMGIHSGPVNEVADVNERANIAGAGINIAQRVMDCGDAGHILLSKHVAEDLQHYPEWRLYLHDVGECEVKHGETISIVNLYTTELGNPNPPRLKQAETRTRKRRRRNALLLGAASLVVLIVGGSFLLPRASGRYVEKSIAVLPFQNLSDEKENAYFADGIQDDILTNLSKIGDLKVISRMSVMSYRGDGVRNAREIGKALGVGTLLEGSVRRAGNRVRVSVQLINANNDEHIWAEDYDRDLTDVFAIQTDLAQKIVSSLQAKLSPNEKEQLDRQPTKDPNAYLLFIQAHDYANRPEHFRDDSLKAEELFEQAIKLDPKFAAAFAGLSMVESWMYHSFEPTPARREKARLNADESLRLQPNLPEGHLALGFSYYYGDRDYERALAEFEIAKRDLPNEAQAYMAIGAIKRRQGKWAESIANLEKAAALDPKNVSILVNLASSYLAVRNFEAAEKTLDRATAIAPESFATVGFKAYLAIASKGDLIGAEKQISSLPADVDPNGVVTWAKSWALTLQRKFPEALTVVQKFPGETLAAEGTGPVPKAFLEGTLHLLQGNRAKAQPALEHALLVSEQLLREAPEDPPRHAQHGLILAALDRKQEAIAEGKRAVELLPESQDAFDGPKSTEALAQIYAWTGELDEAFGLLDHLLTVPNGVAVPILKLDPAWDLLRKDPRFQALIDKYAANR